MVGQRHVVEAHRRGVVGSDLAGEHPRERRGSGGGLLIGLAVLIGLRDLVAQVIALASLALVAAYPFMKRITWWPQAWLGLTFNWGALMGFAAALPLAVLPLTAQPAAAFDRLIATIKRTAGDDRTRVRTRLLELFELFETGDPTVVAARRKLATALY